MIDFVTLYYTLAQIAGVFVGFGALIALSGDQEFDVVERRALVACIMIGLFVIVGALLPILLLAYGLPEKTVWFGSAAAVLLVDWLTIWRQRHGFSDAYNQRRFGDLFSMIGFESLVQIPLILILLPVLQDHTIALYSTMLIVSVFQGAFFLMWLVLERPAKKG